MEVGHGGNNGKWRTAVAATTANGGLPRQQRRQMEVGRGGDDGKWSAAAATMVNGGWP